MGRRSWIGCGLVVIVMLLCIGAAVFGLDRVCYNALSQRLPFYPDAQVTRRVHNFLTEFGMGNTVIALYSPDDPNTVRAWYGRQTGQYLEWAMDNDPFYRIARADWSVERAEDGVGTQILLFGTCAN